MEIREYRAYNETEILSLYASVGWTAYTCQPEALQEGFSRSLVILAAYDGEQLTGLLRAVGDGATVIFLQDILVLPQYQRQGIGTALVQEILRRYPHVRQIQLTTDDTPQTIAFYESLGFRPLQKIGCCGFMKI